jgi:GT2 family glycosyltransferase
VVGRRTRLERAVDRLVRRAVPRRIAWRSALTHAKHARAVVPPTDTPLISVIIVSFHSADVIVDCIERLVEVTDPVATPYEVIVVDNVDAASGQRQPSRTTAALRAQTRGVRLCARRSNAGFGGGNNIGADLARGTILCLCNPDVLLPVGWARPLVDALDDPRVGVAAPAFVNPDGSIQELGQVLLDSGLTLAIGGPDLFPGDWSQAFPRPVDYASAALWMIRRDVFRRLGGFSPSFHPAYWEDVDFALRLEQVGMAVWLVPEVRAVHIGGGSAPTDIGIAQRSHATFKEIWAARLHQQPRHPITPAERVAARDRARQMWQSTVREG